jgi:hypothetical protein
MHTAHQIMECNVSLNARGSMYLLLCAYRGAVGVAGGHGEAAAGSAGALRGSAGAGSLAADDRAVLCALGFEHEFCLLPGPDTYASPIP